MGVTNLCLLIILLGSGRAFAFSVEALRNAEISNFRMLNALDFNKEFVGSDELDVADDTVATGNIDDMFGYADKPDYHSLSRNDHPTSVESLWSALPKDIRAPRNVLQRRRRTGSDERSMLPPWKEFCRMLNMRECNRYKRGSLYRAFRVPLSTRKH